MHEPTPCKGASELWENFMPEVRVLDPHPFLLVSLASYPGLPRTRENKRGNLTFPRLFSRVRGRPGYEATLSFLTLVTILHKGI